MVQSADHLTALTSASPTVTISKNGGSFASPSGAVTEIANGWYKVAGNATDTGTAGPIALHATATSGDPFDGIVAEVVAYDPQDSVRGGMTALSTTAAQIGVNLINIAGSAVSTSTAQLGVNAVSVAAGAINNAAFNADVATAGNTIPLAAYAALNTAFTDATSLNANSLLDRLRTYGWILRNKIAVTDANGNTVIYKDDSTTAGFTVAGMLTDDSTTTTRLRAA